MQVLFSGKNYVEENLCRELNLMMDQVPFGRGSRERG